MVESERDNSEGCAFSMLSRPIQEQLWSMGWESLRPLQTSAIHTIFETRKQIILSAPTAAGKTEAAFLPILSVIGENPMGSVRAIYVGPLKALINDQFGRLGELCSRMETPVHSWHGDISGNKKTKLIEEPGGVLLITPESIEAMFVNRPQKLVEVFHGLKFVVIDELHTFLDNERGLHLRSLLTRLAGKVEKPEEIRWIGLSATLGDHAVAQKYLSPEDPGNVMVIDGAGGEKTLKLKIHCYESKALVEDREKRGDDEEVEDGAFEKLADDLVRHCRGHSNLIFSNSRGDVELLGEACGERALKLGISDRFLVHHGSLAADIRQEAESTMKSGTVATTFCSSTLEMGVDIGSVRMVGQIDPPWSVSSLKQRLGRSGRRSGEAQILRMYVREKEPDGDFLDRLHLKLMGSMAFVELLLSKWVEPPAPRGMDLSTLTHQIMSVIGETGGLGAEEIYERLCVAGPFGDVGKSLFARLLRRLGEKKVIEQMAEGDLILGSVGEMLYRHYSFYSAFMAPETYTLIHETERLGEMDVVPEAGQCIIFSARRWKVADVNREKRVIQVVPARGRGRTRFGGKGGMIHDRIVMTMREILEAGDEPEYLDETGRRLLAKARTTAREVNLGGESLIDLGGDKTLLTTWRGSRINITLMAMMRKCGVEASDQMVGVEIPMGRDAASEWVGRLGETQFKAEELAFIAGNHLPESKYDWLLGDELRAIVRASQGIRIEETLGVLRGPSSV